MAQLVQNAGQYFKVENDGSITPLSAAEYGRERYYQQRMENMGAGAEFGARAGGYFRNTLSGLRELTGMGDPAEEQALRRLTNQQLQPMQDYGSFAGGAGEFLAPATTAVLPGGLYTQMGIGAVQGAAERPESPLTGAGLGAGFTFAGDWVGDVLGRMGSRLMAKRVEVSDTVQRAQDAGIEFTPGQQTGDIQRRLMEQELAKNPIFAGIDAPRFLRNQARLNDLAADYLGVPRTGKMTGDMLGQAYIEAKAGFKLLDNYEGQVGFNPDDMVAVWDDLSQPGRDFMESFARKFNHVLDGPVSGKEYAQARNWLAAQTRKPGNQKLGIVDDIQSIIGVMDEGAVNSVDEVTAAALERARGQWKAMLVVEGAQRSAKSKAGGDITPASAYNSLEKYYGRRFRHGRIRDPFMDAVRGMTEASEAAPVQRPSGNAPGLLNPVQFVTERLYQEPLARSYMEGNALSEILLGASLMDEAIPGSGRAGMGLIRGITADEEEPGNQL